MYRFFAIFVLFASLLSATEVITEVPLGFIPTAIWYNEQNTLNLSAYGNERYMVGYLRGSPAFVQEYEGTWSGLPLPERTLWRDNLHWLQTPYSKNGVTYSMTQIGVNLPNFPETRNFPQVYYNKIESGIASRVCTNLSPNFAEGTSNFITVRGPFVGPDGKEYFFASWRLSPFSPEESGIFTLKLSTISWCEYSLIFKTESGSHYLSAWKLPDGRFLAERYQYPPANAITTEIVIISADGKSTEKLLSGNDCCQMVVDPESYSAAVLYKNNGVPIVAKVSQGKINAEYEVTGLDNFRPINLISLSRDRILILGSRGSSAKNTIITKELALGLQKTIVSGGSVLGMPVNEIKPELLALAPNGDVSYIIQFGPFHRIVREKFTGFEPPPPPPPPLPKYDTNSFASPFFHSIEKSEPGCRELSPGAIISIYGEEMSESTQQFKETPLPTEMAKTAVFVAGQRAPLYFVSPNQINFQVPFETSLGNREIWVERDGKSGPKVLKEIKATSPCFLRVANGEKFFSQVDSVRVYYATGLGNTTPIIRSGVVTPIDQLFHTSYRPETVGTLLFSGLTPGFVGLYQVNVQQD